MRARVVIGLEIHVQLATRTKLFCGCKNSFGGSPNRNLCPVCLGHPGALPVMNREAVRLARRSALALGAELGRVTKWDRKNYFYPDLPKGYQITQYDVPLATGGVLAIGDRHVSIERIHLEEDTGTSKHKEAGTRLDFNRAGLPLLEIVTRPELTSPGETVSAIREIREILRWIGATDGDMEKGQLRAEPNVNLVLDAPGEEIATPVVELKNLNSLAHVAAALTYEIDRQQKAWASSGKPGGPGTKTTRGFDEERGVTVLQRGKEEAEDYRYLPEPDLPPVEISDEEVEELRDGLPELPAARRSRMANQGDLPPKRIRALTGDRALADYFEAASVAAGGHLAQETANWVMGEVLRERGAAGEFPVSPETLGEIVALVASGRITLDAARRRVWPAVISGSATPREIVSTEGLNVSSGEAELRAAVERALAAHPGVATAFSAGKEQAIGPVIGAVLAETGGRADPGRVRELILAVLGEL